MHITVPNIVIDETINRLIVTIDFSEEIHEGIKSTGIRVIQARTPISATRCACETGVPAALQSAFHFNSRISGPFRPSSSIRIAGHGGLSP